MKTKKIIYIFVILIIVFVGLACIWFTKNMRESNLNNTMITEEKAVEIAKDAIKGGMEYDKTDNITVEKEEGRYIVTFPFELPTPASRGPTYAAIVWIDSETGKVIKILSAS